MNATSSASRALRACAIACGVALLAALVWRFMDLLADGYWYIAVGRSVLDGKGFPAVDPFSFASMHGRFVVHMPGSVVAFAWLERHAGLESILVLATAIETIALAWLWLGRAKSTFGRIALAPFVAFAVVLQRDDLSARGQVVGDLAFIALLYVVDAIARGRTRWMFIGPLLGAMWVNLHSSFALGVVVPVVVLVARAFDEEEWSRADLVPFAVLAAGVAAGSLVNPYGPALVRDVLTLASHPTTFEQRLFVSPDFQRWDTLTTYALAALAAALVAADDRGGTRRVVDCALLACFAVFAATGVRYLPHLAYVSIFVAARRLERFESSRIGAALSRHGVVVAAAALALAATWPVGRGHLATSTHVPSEAARFVRERAQPGNVLNEYHWGGYLLYAWMGSPKVFVDGRSYLYYNGVFEDDRALENVDDGAAELLDVYDVKTALLERGSRLAIALESLPGWRKVHEDRLAVVLVRGRP